MSNLIERADSNAERRENRQSGAMRTALMAVIVAIIAPIGTHAVEYLYGDDIQYLDEVAYGVAAISLLVSVLNFYLAANAFGQASYWRKFSNERMRAELGGN
jgi:nitroreductase